MEREEAIDALSSEKEAYIVNIDGKPTICYSAKRIQALEMAIKALQMESCEDAVNRHVVRDTIFEECSGTKLDIDFAKVLILQRAIKALPPIQPKPNVIRCKDCKYVWKEDGWDNLYCNRVKVSGSFAVERDGFCAWGEVKEGE